MASSHGSSSLFSAVLSFNSQDKETLQRPTTQRFPWLHKQRPKTQLIASQFMAEFPISRSSSSGFARGICRQKKFTCRAYVESELERTALQKTKLDLLRAAQDTQRGLLASDDQRASIEETMVSVERYDAGIPIDLSQLDGTWLMQYTSASDVLALLEAARLPFLQVGQIFQKFECKGRVDGGVVRNIVRWSIPSILQENEGATFSVTANFSVLTRRNIFLQFEEVTVGNLIISEELQALIAPAILPRTFLSLEMCDILHSETLCVWNGIWRIEKMRVEDIGKRTGFYVVLKHRSHLVERVINKQIGGLHLVVYITSHIWIVICFWGVHLVVVDFLFSVGHNLYKSKCRWNMWFPIFQLTVPL